MGNDKAYASGFMLPPHSRLRTKKVAAIAAVNINVWGENELDRKSFGVAQILRFSHVEYMT
ncbi:MAG: hypothetical protein H0U49_02700 [Parachlamydiaceae bacterium]|nr:hypothetical protein [Parachlamydiaceae bacterium]